LSSHKEAAAEHAIIGAAAISKPFERNTHPGAQWFPAAGLGLFLHWGIASVFGNTDLSWGMMEDWVWDAPLPGYPKVTPRQYYEEGIAKFHPDKFEPEKILGAAAEAGFKYAVLTTKHHDGFTLFPSKYGEFGAAHSLHGRDLVGEYVDACRKAGMKAGLYYSPPDWYFNRDYMSFNTNKRPDGTRILKNFDLQPIDKLSVMSPEHKKAYTELVRGQTLELLTRYGKIDIIWFDGRGVEENDPDPITIEEIRALQPQILINPRMHGKGDFSTPECQIPKEAPEGWWEVCHLLNDHGWGYTVHPYKSFEWWRETYETVHGMGGNFLTNVGPMPSGELPDVYYERMAQIKAYLERKK